MEIAQRAQTLLFALLLTTTALALAPSAQAAVEPVECAHDVVNNAVSCGGIPTPSTPVGGGLICSYGTGEVGAEVHAGPLSAPLCYRADPAVCGTDPGIDVVENGDSFATCVNVPACGVFGVATASSIDEANGVVCIYTTGSCGIEVIGTMGSIPPTFSVCFPVPTPCGPAAPSPGWGVALGGPCIELVWMDQYPCAGFFGNEVAVGYTPLGGTLANFCL